MAKWGAGGWQSKELMWAAPLVSTSSSQPKRNPTLWCVCPSTQSLTRPASSLTSAAMAASPLLSAFFTMGTIRPMGVCGAGRAGQARKECRSHEAGKPDSRSRWQPLLHARQGPQQHATNTTALPPAQPRPWLHSSKCVATPHPAAPPTHTQPPTHPPTCTAMLQSTVWYWRMNSGNQEAFTSGTLRSARAEACGQAGRQWGGEWVVAPGYSNVH